VVQAGAEICLRGKHFGIARNQQDVVEGEGFISGRIGILHGRSPQQLG
jgi:hypothetical protein